MKGRWKPHPEAGISGVALPQLCFFFFFNKLNYWLDPAEKSIAGLEKAVKIHGAKLATPQAAVRLLGWCDPAPKGGKKI